MRPIPQLRTPLRSTQEVVPLLCNMEKTVFLEANGQTNAALTPKPAVVRYRTCDPGLCTLQKVPFVFCRLSLLKVFVFFSRGNLTPRLSFPSLPQALVVIHSATFRRRTWKSKAAEHEVIVLSSLRKPQGLLCVSSSVRLFFQSKTFYSHACFLASSSGGFGVF